MMRFLRCAMGDQRGVAAMEFALVFPIIFVLHLTAIDALQAYQAQRAVAHIAAAMADITAQDRSVTQAEMDDVLAASVVMIQPFPSTGLQQRVTSFVANGSGTVTPDWSVKKNYSDGVAAKVPANFLQSNESVIVTDVIYDYRPRIGLFLPEKIRFVRHAYARPRLSTKVEGPTP